MSRYHIPGTLFCERSVHIEIKPITASILCLTLLLLGGCQQQPQPPTPSQVNQPSPRRMLPVANTCADGFAWRKTDSLAAYPRYEFLGPKLPSIRIDDDRQFPDTADLNTALRCIGLPEVTENVIGESVGSRRGGLGYRWRDYPMGVLIVEVDRNSTFSSMGDPFISAIEVGLRLKDLYGSGAKVDLLDSPDRVQIYRLCPYRFLDVVSPGEPKDPVCRSIGNIGDYTIRSGPINLRDNLEQSVLTALTNPRVAYFPKFCAPMPGIDIRIRKGNDALDFLICFECSEILILHNGHPAGMSQGDGVRGVFLDMPEETRLELLRVAKQMYRNDREIQELE